MPGALLPLRPRPEEDELLSSWLVRLAWANGTSPRVLYHSLGLPAHHFEQDLDRGTIRPLILTLAARTGLPRVRVYRATLAPYQERLHRQTRHTSLKPWVLPLIFRAGRVHGYGQQVCPDCLATDEVAHYRRAWRLALLTVCPEHHRLLLDRCPGCNTPLDFRGVHGELRTPPEPNMVLSSCSACGLDLRTLATQGYDPEPILVRGRFRLPDEVGRHLYEQQASRVRTVGVFENRLLRALNVGSWPWGTREQPILEVMQGLRQLVRWLTHDPRARRFREAMREVGRTLPSCEAVSEEAETRFEHRDIRQRHQIMENLAWLTFDGCSHLAEVYRRSGTTKPLQLLR